MRAKDDGGALFTSVSAEPERPLARLLDAASRRDFIYLVLILALARQVELVSAFGRARGADLFFPGVFLAARERSRDTRSASGA